MKFGTTSYYRWLFSDICLSMVGGGVAIGVLVIWINWLTPALPQKSRFAGNPVVAAPLKGQEYTNSIGMKFKWIEPGSFLIGSPDGTTPPAVPAEKDRFPNEKPHQVTLTHGYYMGVYPVTKGQFAAFVQDANYQTASDEEGREDDTWHNPGFRNYIQSDNDPVVCVTYNDCVKFCEWLSKKEGRTYQLPTEAQWEYAYRAGTTTAYFFGDDPKDLGDYAWFDEDAGRHTHPVGERLPNPWGIYDMAGNVGQWCRDDYVVNPTNNGIDSITTSKGSADGHVCRGGGWIGPSEFCRAACRISLSTTYLHYTLGFRVCLRPD